MTPNYTNKREFLNYLLEKYSSPEGCNSVVKHLPGRHKTLGSIPSTAGEKHSRNSPRKPTNKLV
jgi:hypothetical protein